MKRLADGAGCLPERHYEHVIAGGNHAQFGDYGAQRGDGRATVSAGDQRRMTAELVLSDIAADDGLRRGE